MPSELEREQAELQRLRASGNPAALHDADRLEKAYHVRQMNGLAQDVYYAAKGESPKAVGHPPQDYPPHGWTRLSEHPELVAQYAQRLHMTQAQLMDTLHPDNSGFRIAINRYDSRNIETTLANLPPHIQQQVYKHHAVRAYVPIRHAA